MKGYINGNNYAYCNFNSISIYFERTLKKTPKLITENRCYSEKQTD